LGIRIALLLSVLPLILLGITGNAFASQAGSDTDNAASGVQIMESGDGPFSVGASISACDPVDSCPPIVKTFDFPDEGTSSTVMIHEDWTVGPGPPWWDWHEVIPRPPGTQPQWQFQQVQIESTNGAPCPSTSSQPPLQDVIDPSGQEVWIDFDDVSNVGLLQQNDHLCIWKEVFPIVSNQLQLVIWEWPTIHKFAVGGEFIPIDATAVLIAGAQSNALTILSAFVVIGALAFGALVISVKRKRN